MAAAEWATPWTLSGAGQSATQPQVAVDEDGDTAVIWQRSDGTNERIQTRTCFFSCAVLRTWKTVSAGGHDAGSPQVAVDADGDAVFVWARFDGTNQRIQTRGQSADGVLGPVQNVSPAGGYAFEPQVAIDPGGDAVITWRLSDSSGQRVQMRARSAAGILGPVASLSGAGQDAYNPQVAVGANGDAVFVWVRSDGSTNRVQTRVLSASGVLGPGRTISAAGRDAFNAKVAVDADGDAVFVWGTSDGTNQRIQARARSAAGVFGPGQNVSPAGRDAFQPQVAIDPDGEAVFTWRLSLGPTDRIQTRARSTAGELSARPDPLGPGERCPGTPGGGRHRWCRGLCLAAPRQLGVLAHRSPNAFPGGHLGNHVETLSDGGQNAFLPQVSADATPPGGVIEAKATWQRFDGANFRVEMTSGP